jgi:hypothetical protein
MGAGSRRALRFAASVFTFLLLFCLAVLLVPAVALTGIVGGSLLGAGLETIVVILGSYWIALSLSRSRSDEPLQVALAGWYVGSRLGSLLATSASGIGAVARSIPYVVSLGLLPAWGAPWSIAQTAFAFTFNLIAAGAAFLGFRRGAATRGLRVG